VRRPGDEGFGWQGQPAGAERFDEAKARDRIILTLEQEKERSVRSTSIGAAFVDHKAPWIVRLIGKLFSGVILIPVLATMAASLALMVYGAFETWHFLDGLFF